MIEEIAAGVAYRSAAGQHHGDFEFRPQRLEQSGDGGLPTGAEGVGPCAANADRKSFDDLKPMWACRIGVTRAAARKALAAALKDSGPRR